MSLSIVQRTKLTILLDFKSQATVSLISVIISGLVGIYIAYHGGGVWALVYQSLINNTLQTIILWLITKWMPIRSFSYTSFKNMFSFGSKLLISGLLHTIYLNLYSLVIGKAYNANDAGLFNRAYTIAQFPATNIVSILTRVFYPIQCEHQNDNEWLETSFRTYLRMACFIVFPIMCFLAVVAKPLVLLILSEKWESCALLISILSIAYMWYPVMLVNNQMLMVKGRSDLYLKSEIIKKIIAITIMIITIPLGLIFLCMGLIAYSFCDIIIIIWFVKKVIKTGYLFQIKAILPILCLSVFSAVISWLTMTVLGNIDINSLSQSYIVQVSGSIITYTLIFFLGSYIFKFNEIKLLINTLNQYIKKR